MTSPRDLVESDWCELEKNTKGATLARGKKGDSSKSQENLSFLLIVFELTLHETQNPQLVVAAH